MNKNLHSHHKIRFSDGDLIGHLNNARYLDYFMAWLVGSHEIVYLRPAQYNEQVIIQSTLLFAEPNLLHFKIIMLNESMDQLK